MTQRAFNKVQLSELVSSDPGTADVLLKGTPAVPSDNSALVTWGQVQSLSGSLSAYAGCVASPLLQLDATSSGNTMTAANPGALQVDGITVSVNDRILVRLGNTTDPGTTSAYNGIYTVTATGDGANPWVMDRAADVLVHSGYTIILQGETLRYNTYFISSATPSNINTDPIQWDLLSGGGNVRFDPAKPAAADMVPIYTGVDGQEISASTLSLNSAGPGGLGSLTLLTAANYMSLEFGIGLTIDSTVDGNIVEIDGGNGSPDSAYIETRVPLTAYGLKTRVESITATGAITYQMWNGDGLRRNGVEITKDSGANATVTIELPPLQVGRALMITVTGLFDLTSANELTVAFADTNGGSLSASIPDMVVNALSPQTTYRILINPTRYLLV